MSYYKSPPSKPFLYQHDDWIGGHGNVLKHIVLMAVIQSYQKIYTGSSTKNGIMVVDCMAGDGVYDLNQHTNPKAYQNGILQVMNQALADPSNTPDIVQQYVQHIMKITGCTTPQVLDVYPGSPIIVQHLLRPNIDEHRLLNIDHTIEEIQWLQLNTPKVATTTVKTNLDAFDIENSIEYILPYTDTSQCHHPIILIDPDYTDEVDYSKTKNLLSILLQQCSHATIIVTIPIIHNHIYRYTYMNQLRDVAKQYCTIGRYYCNIIISKGNERNKNMTTYIGDAVLVCNPTNNLDDTILNDHCLHWLAHVMNQGKDEYTIEQIMKKKKEKK